jgi:hypothetical protein
MAQFCQLLITIFAPFKSRRTMTAVPPTLREQSTFQQRHAHLLRELLLFLPELPPGFSLAFFSDRRNAAFQFPMQALQLSDRLLEFALTPTNNPAAEASRSLPLSNAAVPLPLGSPF